MVIAIVLNSLAIIAVAAVVYGILKELKLNNSFWDSAVREFNQIWYSMYEFTGVDPNEVGEPIAREEENTIEESQEK